MEADKETRQGKNEKAKMMSAEKRLRNLFEIDSKDKAGNILCLLLLSTNLFKDQNQR